MYDFVPQGLRYGKSPTVNHGTSRRRDDGFHVAGLTANAVKKFVTLPGLWGGGQSLVPRGYLGAPHELGEVIDIVQTQVIRSIFGVRRGLGDRGGILRLQAVADANFHLVGLARKGKQAAILVFPAKSPHSCLPRRFQNRNLNGLTVNLAVVMGRLILGDRHQRVVGNGLNKAISQSVEHSPPRADVFCVWHMLLCLWGDGAIVDQRTTLDDICAVIDEDGRVHEIAIVVPMTHAEFGNLAGPTGYGILMAGNTGGRVVNRT